MENFRKRISCVTLFWSLQLSLPIFVKWEIKSPVKISRRKQNGPRNQQGSGSSLAICALKSKPPGILPCSARGSLLSAPNTADQARLSTWTFSLLKSNRSLVQVGTVIHPFYKMIYEATMPKCVFNLFNSHRSKLESLAGLLTSLFPTAPETLINYDAYFIANVIYSRTGPQSP